MNLKRVNSTLLIILTLLGTILAMFGTLPNVPIVAEVHAAPPNNPAILGLFSEAKKSNVVVDTLIRSPQSFRLDVNITDAGLIKGYDINITWTAAFLSVKNSTFSGAGCPLAQGCLFAVVSTTRSNTTDNVHGFLRLAVVDTDSGTPFVNGNGILFRVGFNALSGTGAATVIHIERKSLIQNPGSVPYKPIDAFYDSRSAPFADFPLAVSPTIVTINRPVLASSSASQTATVSIATAPTGLASVITLQALGLPLNTGAVFAPSTCPAAATCSSTLTLTINGGPKGGATTTPSGNYSIPIIGNTTATGISGNLVKSIWLKLVIRPPPAPVFNFSASRKTYTQEAGNQTFLTLNATLVSGTNDSIAFGTNCFPNFASAICEVKPQTGGLIVKPGFLATLNVTTSASATKPGTYKFNATATSQGTYSEVLIAKNFTITVTVLKTHDLAVQAFSASRNFAYAGVSLGSPLKLNVTVANLGTVTETSFVVNSTARVVLLNNDCRLAFVDANNNQIYDTGETVILDSDCNGLFGSGLLDFRIKYVDTNGNNVWDPGETVILDADSSGTYNPSLTDTVIAGSPTFGRSLTLDTSIRFVDSNANGVWNTGEPVVQDSNGDGKYSFGKFHNDTLVSGIAPLNNTAVALDTLIKFADTNSNQGWDSGEPVVYDINNNNVYDPDFVIAGTAPASGTAVKLSLKLEFVDLNTNGAWDLGETVFNDANGNHVFDTGEAIIVGTAPAAETVLTLTAPPPLATALSPQHLSYVDSNLNQVWDSGESIVWDNGTNTNTKNGLYDTGETVAVGSTPSGGLLLASTTATLAPNTSTIVTLSWDASTLQRGKYIIGAAVAPVSGELNTGNNVVLFLAFTQKFRGDLDGNCVVNILDVGTVNTVFGQNLGGSRYNPVADQNNDAKINILDVTLVNAGFGTHC